MLFIVVLNEKKAVLNGLVKEKVNNIEQHCIFKRLLTVCQSAKAPYLHPLIFFIKIISKIHFRHADAILSRSNLLASM